MKKIILYLINKYKKNVSPIFEHFGVKCKYYPTCSEYMKQAITKYGVFHGLYLGMKRFFKCNPFSKGGYDPVR